MIWEVDTIQRSRGMKQKEWKGDEMIKIPLKEMMTRDTIKKKIRRRINEVEFRMRTNSFGKERYK